MKIYTGFCYPSENFQLFDVTNPDSSESKERCFLFTRQSRSNVEDLLIKTAKNEYKLSDDDIYFIKKEFTKGQTTIYEIFQGLNPPNSECWYFFQIVEEEIIITL